MEVDEKFRIVYDENNVILQFHEIRIKSKKDETKEEYEFVDNFYYSNIAQALKSYTNKCLKGSDSISELIQRIENLETLIPNLK
jgi:hypothetical protein